MIDSFSKQNFFLSNFFPCIVTINSIKFGSSEHAYQAAKSLDRDIWEQIAQLKTANESKQFGRRILLRSDWEQKKIQIMTNIIMIKFIQNIDLWEKLINTGNEELIEGNYWGDTFWGISHGKGENNLGKILMIVRQKLRNIF